jgi:hypothetical protein
VFLYLNLVDHHIHRHPQFPITPQPTRTARSPRNKLPSHGDHLGDQNLEEKYPDQSLERRRKRTRRHQGREGGEKKRRSPSSNVPFCIFDSRYSLYVRASLFPFLFQISSLFPYERNRCLVLKRVIKMGRKNLQVF